MGYFASIKREIDFISSGGFNVSGTYGESGWLCYMLENEFLLWDLVEVLSLVSLLPKKSILVSYIYIIRSFCLIFASGC